MYKKFLLSAVLTLSVLSLSIKEQEATVEPTTEPPTETSKSVVTIEPVELGTVTEPVTEVITAPEFISLGEFKLTAYCSCSECCGKWANDRPVDNAGNELVYGASGELLTAGYSVAVDPTVIPYGTVIVINGKEYKAQDCGGAIKDKRIDVYFNDHAEALEFGVQYAEVFKEVK